MTFSPESTPRIFTMKNAFLERKAFYGNNSAMISLFITAS
jgi:hypothetical protein